MDPRKEFVPPRFSRRCNDRYFVAGGMKDKYISQNSGSSFIAHAWSFSLSLSPLFLMQAEKWKTGKNWLTFIFIRNGYECSVLSLSPLIHLFIDVDVFCFETHSNIHHHSVFPYPGIVLSYSQRKPTLF